MYSIIKASVDLFWVEADWIIISCSNSDSILLLFLFFFENAWDLCFISLRRKINHPYNQGLTSPSQIHKQQGDTRPKTTLLQPSALGLATYKGKLGTQELQSGTKLASIDTAHNTSMMYGFALLKTQSVRCFQISQATRMINEFSPFYCSLGTFLTAFHHHLAKRVTEGWGAEGQQPPLPASRKSRSEHAERKHMRQGWMVTSFWSHSGQVARCASPCLASRSTVQQRLFMANRRKNLQCRGAQLIQIHLQGANLMDPRK